MVKPDEKGPDREPRLIEIGEPEVVGAGEDLGVRWTLTIRPMVTEAATFPGLYLETADGQGGGGGRSKGFDPAPGFVEVSMTAIDPGLVGIYGPLAKWPLMTRVTVECADGTTRPVRVLLGPEPYQVDFFVAIVDREPARLTVTTEHGGQWFEFDKPGFQYRVHG